MEADKLKLNPNQADLFIICTNLQRNNVIDNFPLNCWKGYIATTYRWKARLCL